MSDFATLKLACLAGGFIYILDDVQDMQRAEQSGAVGIGLKTPSVEGYKYLVKNCSVNIVSDDQNLSLFETACQSQQKTNHTCLVLHRGRPQIQTPNYSPLISIKDEAELHTVVAQKDFLMVINNVELLAQAQEILMQYNKKALLFFEGETIEDIHHAIEIGNDGCVFNGFFRAIPS